MDHFSGMPESWAYLPFGDPRIKELKEGVTAIPQLTVITGGGQVLRENARNDVFKEGTPALSRWLD